MQEGSEVVFFAVFSGSTFFSWHLIPLTHADIQICVRVRPGFEEKNPTNYRPTSGAKHKKKKTTFLFADILKKIKYFGMV